MENMVIIAEDIIEQPVVSVLTNYREIFLVGEQAATTFKTVDDPWALFTEFFVRKPYQAGEA